MLSHVAMRVPVVIGARVDQLHDAHAALDEPPGDQALVAKRGFVAFLDSVRVEGSPGFAGGVECLGGLVHHASGDIERGDPGVKIAIAGPGGGMAEVDVAKHDLLELMQRHGPFRWAQVGDRLGARDDPHPLVDRRQKATVPELRAAIRQVFAEHDVRRQCGVKRSQSMA